MHERPRLGEHSRHRGCGSKQTSKSRGVPLRDRLAHLLQYRTVLFTITEGRESERESGQEDMRCERTPTASIAHSKVQLATGILI